MVKKLFKHEYASYFRILIPVYIILLLAAAFGRLSFEFESDTIAYDIIFIASCVIFVFTCFAAILFSSWYGIVRFYKNLFTSEGYLSFTLPVTPAQHLWVKSTTAVSCNFLTFIMIFLSAALFVKGPLIAEIWKAGAYLFNMIPQEYTANAVIIVIEFVLMFVVTMYTSYFMLYSCITIGQLAKKNRILAAIGVYIGYSIISQIASTIYTVLATVTYEFSEYDYLEEGLAEATTAEVLLGVEIAILIGLLIAAFFGFIYFIISRHIMTKKLNLE